MDASGKWAAVARSSKEMPTLPFRCSWIPGNEALDLDGGMQTASGRVMQEVHALPQGAISVSPSVAVGGTDSENERLRFDPSALRIEVKAMSASDRH
jgi:hypothetical protein